MVIFRERELSKYLAAQHLFPALLPTGIAPLPNEPVFDLAKHLQIEMPEKPPF
jgi:hypothetical protein